MKKIIFILVLIGGLAVGGSYQVGKVIEAELPNILARVGELGQMQISITSYERSIFRSSVRSEIVLASLSGSREQIFLRHEIWHGPFPFGKSSNGTWQFKPLSALVETTIDRSNPPSGLIGEAFELCPELYNSIEQTRFDFAGNGHSNYTIPAFEKNIGEGDDALYINWQGMTGAAHIDKSMKNVRGEVLVPSVKVSSRLGHVVVDATRSNYNIFEDFGGLLLGSVTVDTAGIEAGSGRSKTVLKDLQFRNKAELNEELVSYSIAVGIESLQTENETYGPAGFEIDFVGLDAKTILNVQKKLQTFHSSVKTLNEEEIASHVFSIYAEALPGLIKKNPEIMLNYLNLTGPNGNFWLKGNVRFENRLNRPIKDLNALLGTIRAKGESQIGKPLLQSLLTDLVSGQLDQARSAGQLGDISDDEFNAMAAKAAAKQLAQMEANGLIIAERDNYEVDLVYANRQATLNGKPLQ